FIAMVVFGLSGIPGLLLGGIAGDVSVRRRASGRLLIGAGAIAASVPLLALALGAGRGEWLSFALFMGCGCALMYIYYSSVYPTIQDVIDPSLRGTAMALYFFAMYVVGASLGPVGTGFLSDPFPRRAALAAGVTAFTPATLEPYRAAGLHAAMYV